MNCRLLNLTIVLLAAFGVQAAAQSLKTETVDGLGAKVWKITADREPNYSDRTVNPIYFIYLFKILSPYINDNP